MSGLFLSDEPYEEPVVVHPGKVPGDGNPHVLVVGEDGLLFRHDFSCEDRYGDVQCDVEYAEQMAGEDIRTYFHDADMSPSGEVLTDGLVPGEYWVIMEVHHNEWWTNYGLDHDVVYDFKLMYPEEEWKEDSWERSAKT